MKRLEVRMRDDMAELTKLNVEIGLREAGGDRDWLEKKLATKLAFQRANDAKTIVDAGEFLIIFNRYQINHFSAQA